MDKNKSIEFFLPSPDKDPKVKEFIKQRGNDILNAKLIYADHNGIKYQVVSAK